MDPLSSLGIATAVVQFLDFTGTVISGTWKFYKANGSETAPNADIRSLTESLIKISNNLQSSISEPGLQSAKSLDPELRRLGDKCIEIARRLLSALDRLRCQSKHQFWASFRLALRTVWSQKDIEALFQTLEGYRHQISMHILVSLREQVGSSSQAQKRSLDETQDICRKILSNVVNDTESKVTKAALEEIVKKATEKTATVAERKAAEIAKRETAEIVRREEAKNTKWQAEVLDVILRSYRQNPPDTGSALLASGMQGILQKGDNDDIRKCLLDSLRFREMNQRYERIALAHQTTFGWVFLPPSGAAKWTGFSDWMENDEQPFYWITGKAGAGKTTLMRFIYEHPSTYRTLRSWSGDRPLLMASFFFWNSGTDMQMSYDGLVRTLLFQILRQVPHLISEVLPHRMEAGILFGIEAFQKEPWNWEELLGVFRILMKKTSERFKTMLFIDGMDEFQGKPSELIDLMTSLIVPGVKICASSRPWIAFEDAFGHLPHLRLEDLTYHDINSYVTSKMKANTGFELFQELDPDFASRLIENVCERSSGVFLWVCLVTQSLLEGLSEGERLCDLQARLDSLPLDLENLFWSILSRLDHQHFGRACQFFQIIGASLFPLTLLDMAFTDEDDVEFATKMPCKMLTLQEAIPRAEIMRRRITACCKGLLEARALAKEDLPNAEVGYLHRTVRDYLQRSDTWTKICGAIHPDFNANLRLCSAQVVRLKTQNPHSVTRNSLWRPVTYAIEYAVRGDPTCSSYQARILDEIDKAAEYMTTFRYRNGSNFLTQSSILTYERATYWTSTRNDCRESTIFLEFAVQCQLIHYVDIALKQMSPSSSSRLATQLLWTAIAHHKVFLNEKDRPALSHMEINGQLVQLLFRYDADPNFNIRPVELEPHTIWDQLLRQSEGKRHLDIVEYFLLAGADPRNSTLEGTLPAFSEELRELVHKKRGWVESGWRLLMSYGKSRS